MLHDLISVFDWKYGITLVTYISPLFPTNNQLTCFHKYQGSSKKLWGARAGISSHSCMGNQDWYNLTTRGGQAGFSFPEGLHQGSLEGRAQRWSQGWSWRGKKPRLSQALAVGISFFLYSEFLWIRNWSDNFFWLSLPNRDRFPQSSLSDRKGFPWPSLMDREGFSQPSLSNREGQENPSLLVRESPKKNQTGKKSWCWSMNSVPYISDIYNGGLLMRWWLYKEWNIQPCVCMESGMEYPALGVCQAKAGISHPGCIQDQACNIQP